MKTNWEQQRAWVEINLGALARNVRAIKNLLAPTTTMVAVVKADAYGHGAIDVAETVLASGAEWLAVATVPEGVELRQQGIGAPILILGAVNSELQVDAIVRWGLQPTLVSSEQATQISKAIVNLGLDTTLKVHLKLDTGMSRLGVNWQQAVEFVEIVENLSQLQIASLYSHLATADELDPTVMDLQSERFDRAIAQIASAGHRIPMLHLANSAGILAGEKLHYQMVRPGLILYGLYPAPHLRSRLDLQPVLQVRARITQVKDISAGTGVSYGHRYISDRDLRIAVVGIGYADGIPRRLSDRMQVSIRGQLIPQIGAITMDQIVLDVSQIPDLQVGEVVTILGRDGDSEITVDDWADILGTISWEILCGFKHRLPRIAFN
jgi:alanine racemase